MTGAVKCTLNEADLLAAYRLRSRGGWLKKLGLVMFLWLAIGLAVAAVKDGFDSLGTTAVFIATVLLLGMAVFIAVALSVHFIFGPRYAKHIFGQQKDLQEPFELSWNDEQLVIESRTSRSWSNFADFIKWRSDGRLLLIYKSANLFHLIPLRFFDSDTQIETLIERFEAMNVPGKRF